MNVQITLRLVGGYYRNNRTGMNFQLYDTFGEEINAIDVVPDAASKAHQIWPTHIARIDDQWWINNMRSAMNEGGIYIFDNDWQFKHRVELPDGADPIAIRPFRGKVLVSDWNNNRIYQVSKSGKMLVDFPSAGFSSRETSWKNLSGMNLIITPQISSMEPMRTQIMLSS